MITLIQNYGNNAREERAFWGPSSDIRGIELFDKEVMYGSYIGKLD